MGKNRLDQNWQAEDFLELNANKLLYEVKEDLSIYDLPLQINKAQLEELFRKTLIPEVEETEAPEITRGWVKVKKDGTGKYVAMKNLHFYLLDFLEGVLGLVQTTPEYRIILGTMFLIRMWQRMGIDLGEEQTAAYVILSQQTKRYVVTDENVFECMLHGLSESGYSGLSMEKAEKILSELMDMGLVFIEDGRFEAAETVLIES